LNTLYVGFSKEVELPPRGYLFIDDDVPEIPQSRVFDPTEHSFNPLKNIDYRTARALSELLYTISPQGENTLTVRNGKRALLKALLSAEPIEDVKGMTKCAA